MADVKIVKSIYTGGDVTSLGEVTAADNVKLPGTFEVTGNSKLTTVNKVAITEPATGATLALTDGKTLSVTQDTVLSGSPYTPGGTDVAITDGGTGASTAATAFANLKQAASESATGVAELATVAEAIAGTDTARVVTPAGLAAHVAVMRNPLTPAQAINMTAAASGSTGIQTLDNAAYRPGIYDMAWSGKVRLPVWHDTLHILFFKGASVPNRFMVRTNTASRLMITPGTASEQAYTLSSALVAGTEYDIMVVCQRESAGATGLVSVYINGYLSGTPIEIAAGAPTDINNTNIMYLLGTATTREAGIVRESYLFNFAPTAAEVLDVYINGIPESWKWGSQTEVATNGDFQSGDTGWTKEAGWTIVDQGGGQYKAVATNAGNLYSIQQPAGRTIAVGEKWLVTYTVSDYESGSVWPTIGGGGGLGTKRTANGTYTEIVTVDITWNTYGFRAGAAGTTLKIDNCSFIRLGVTGAWESEGIQPAPGQWLDSSSNKNHAMQPASGSSLTRRMKTFEIRWTNTWAGTHELQYIGGVNQAILPANCYIESIIGVITGATIEDIIIGDGSDTDRWVAITTGLAAGTVAFTIANRISDGTNYKMTVDPDANFTGSIAWTITGRILQ